jgi:PDZ domain/Trypsin-like peptidase domain
LLPEVKDEVLAYGYPVGGNSLSITKGIVSRIEFVTYSFPTSGLRIQIDAAINPGNSGGPVFVGDKMIGLAFSGILGAQNIGYIIPNEEVELFLKDIADGQYDGKPALFDEFQTLENPSLRSFLKVDKSVKGMALQRPAVQGADYPLKSWDIVTHIGAGSEAMAIDNQGMTQLTPDIQVRFQYRVQRVVKDGYVPFTVIREGKSLQVQVPVTARRPRLISGLQGSYPSYFIYGPIVLSRATLEFRSFFNNNASALNSFAFNAQPLLTRVADEPTAEREDLVVVSSPFFPHRLVSGYDGRFGAVVKSVNDIPVRSLRHFVEIIRDMKDELVVLKFDQRSSESIVVAHAQMLQSTESILADNGIRALASSDLMDVWSAKTR